MRILAIGDSSMLALLRGGFSELGTTHQIEVMHVNAACPFESPTASVLTLREYQGSAAELIEHMAGLAVLVVHGAPVTNEVLRRCRSCGSSAVRAADTATSTFEAVTARDLPLVNTRGTNAEAVAVLTFFFFLMLACGVPTTQRFLQQGHQLKDNWEGARFIGSDLRRHVFGLVGYG